MGASPLSESEASGKPESAQTSEVQGSFQHLPLKDLPYKGDLVWCKWPGTKFGSGDRVYVRPTLVLDGWTESKDDLRYGVLRVCYGTDIESRTRSDNDLVFDDPSENRRCDLKKRTRFVVKDPYVKELLWCSEYFMPQDYIANGSIFIGSVSDKRIVQIDKILVDRGEYIED